MSVSSDRQSLLAADAELEGLWVGRVYFTRRRCSNSAFCWESARVSRSRRRSTNSTSSVRDSQETSRPLSSSSGATSSPRAARNRAKAAARAPCDSCRHAVWDRVFGGGHNSRDSPWGHGRNGFPQMKEGFLDGAVGGVALGQNPQGYTAQAGGIAAVKLADSRTSKF